MIHSAITNDKTSQSEEVPQPQIISIILPMHDHRGVAIEAVESWVKHQRCNPDDFEVLLIIDDTLQEFEETFRRMLRFHDMLINQSADNEMGHYDIDAKQSMTYFLLCPFKYLRSAFIRTSDSFYYV